MNVKLSNLQLDKLKLGIKNDTQVTLNLSSNVSSDSNDETNFPNKLLLTDTPIRLHKSFATNSSAYMKISKTQLNS